MRLASAVCFFLLCVSSHGVAAEPGTQAPLAQRFSQMHSVLKRFCLDCHSTSEREGELDLERFSTFNAVRQDVSPWRKVVEMLENQEMPPEDVAQPSQAERELVLGWSRDMIEAEIRARAGDPGRVLLRRLNNAEYTYTIQDLTGVPLEPAREFPVDGAAGEGFTNTGEALAMSPALVQKYLDAGKQIAEHAVLLPDGFRFSMSKTRRDWSDEILARIRRIYARHTTGESDTSVLNRWSTDPNRSTENDGRVDLKRYFSALIRHRELLLKRLDDVEKIAKSDSLNAKYLRVLAEMLVSPTPDSLLLHDIRGRWMNAEVEDAETLAAAARNWQKLLWKFNPVGQLGLLQPWQQPQNPLVESVALRRSLAVEDGSADISMSLVVTDAGDGSTGDVATLVRPRIEFKDRPPILLRDVRELTGRLLKMVESEGLRTDQYLAALADARTSPKPIEALASKRNLNAALLDHWARFLGFGAHSRRDITGHFTRKLSGVAGYEVLNGWATNDLPVLLTNRSDEDVSFSTLTVPAGGVTVHPTPEQDAIVAWKSPIEGKVRIEGNVADADDKCGNGAAWRVEKSTVVGVGEVTSGVIDNGRSQAYSVKVEVEVGDVLSLVVNARDRGHACDTTHVEFKISELGGDKRVWDLASDVVADVHAGNPHSDAYGHADTWHFLGRDAEPPARSTVPPSSALARWLAAVVENRAPDETRKLAAGVRDVLAATDVASLSMDDRLLREKLADWNGPLDWIGIAVKSDQSTVEPVENDYGLDPAEFGKRIDGSRVDSSALIVQAPRQLTFVIPAALVEGGTFAVEAALDSPGNTGSVQVAIADAPQTARLLPGEPIITKDNGAARTAVARAYDDFRTYFPEAMCHARIVPVDSVVTLVLYHREDDHFKRLMLSEEESAHLDRLWEELLYVSQDALRLEVALEQILEFATQDADPKVYYPMRQPIANNAKAYRKQRLDAEPLQLQSLIRFADLAYRRPMAREERSRLVSLYESLRKRELSHEAAFRLTLARLLASPAFLYRLEEPGNGSQPAPVSNWELASRLSYFLWSSMPDAELRAEAKANRLTDSQALLAQTRRMLRDERVRRLAVEFACQWLHLRDFDQHDEKNERLFPEFADLRGDMYEETIRFFEAMFRDNGSILGVLDARHTFVNESLARHYGIPNVTGDRWRRVENVRGFGRGGILAQASMLARQSGASRTSPILRGNWISETLLGERLPRPPKNVPQLPDDEAATKDLSMRQLVEKHSSDPACAKCHARIDPYGFALEHYDAIGRFRKSDAAGRPIDTRTKLMDGTPVDGAEGLRDYLVNDRREAFVRQFCRKLLGFALGRAVQLSDEPLLKEMSDGLKKTDYRFWSAVETIVLSKQFRMIRGIDDQGTTH